MSLIDESGAPIGFAGIVNHVHYHEPGNLVFVYLLQNGAFHELCKQYSGSQLLSKLVLVLAHLFTNVRLPRNFERASKKFHNSIVAMEPLPSEFEQLIEKYKDQVSGLLAAFLQQMCKGQSLQGEIFSLAGRQDCQVDMMAGDIIMPLNKDIIFDQSLLPTFAYPPTDHRGRKCLMNAYACDFYLHSVKQALVHDNGMKEGDVYHLVNDFQLTLKSIATALSVVGQPGDVVVEAMNKLAEDYQCKFNKAFPRYRNGW